MEQQLHPFDDFPPQNPKIPKRKTPNFDEQRHKRVMGKLKDSIFTTLKASNPPRPISRALKSHIAKQMREFLPSFAIPTHPPYALMIETAIKELNEERGPNEESILRFIEKNYEGLPWGHATFLSHHLRKLCGTGEIVCKNDGRYIIPVDQSGVEGKCLVEVQENEMINEWNAVREKQVIVFEEQRQVEKKAAEASEQEVERPSVSSYDAWQRNPQYQHIKVKEGPNNFQELHFEAIDKHALACVQKNQIVVFEQNIPEEETCMELVKKKTELQENSHSFGGMEERNVDLEVEQHQHERILRTARACDVKVIGGGKLLQDHDRFIREENRPQEHHVEGETKVLGFHCVTREDLIENLWVSLDDWSLTLTMLKERLKKSVKKEPPQMRNILEERKFVIICGLQAQQRPEPNIYGQQKVPKSHPDNQQQQLSQDTTMGVLLSSAHQQDIEQQLEGQGRVRPSEIEGHVNHHAGHRIYVRRRRSA